MICGLYDTLHFFCEDPGSRQEIVSFLERVIKSLQENGVARRKKQRELGSNGKLTFALAVGKQTVFAP